MVSDHERAVGRAGVTRSGSVVSDHERQGLRVSRAWVRGLPWSPTMSAMGPGGCHAVRVRGERQGLGGCHALGSVVSDGL